MKWIPPIHISVAWEHNWRWVDKPWTLSTYEPMKWLVGSLFPFFRQPHDCLKKEKELHPHSFLPLLMYIFLLFPQLGPNSWFPEETPPPHAVVGESLLEPFLELRQAFLGTVGNLHNGESFPRTQPRHYLSEWHTDQIDSVLPGFQEGICPHSLSLCLWRRTLPQGHRQGSHRKWQIKWG